MHVQSIMIGCVTPFSSFLPKFNSIHDTLHIWAIENSTSLTPKCPWDMVASEANQPMS